MKKSSLYRMVSKFKAKYPFTVTWRLKAHCKVIEKHLSFDEKIVYAFAAQKNNNSFDIVTTCVVALTEKRLVIAQKRVLFGYFFYSITPDMFNDLQIRHGLLWGRIYIDTINEMVILSNISKKALIEIEKNISSYMMEEKKKYPPRKK
ncbi:MAG TPA: hypothetical protein GX725_04135 [Mollicutes bacterium]|jgi:hypothetical protein|nr:hypothetical protein [Mollicutes bacterium]